MLTSLSPSPSAWPLPVLSRNQAQAFERIAAHAQQMGVTVAQQDWWLTLTPTVQPATTQAVAPICVLLDWSGSLWQLWLDSAQLQHLVTSVLPSGTALPALPTSLHIPLLQAALAPLIAQLAQLQRGPASVKSIHTSQLPRPAEFAMRWQLQPADASVARTPLHGHLHTDSLGLMSLAGVLAQRPIPVVSPDPHLPLCLHATLGSSNLSSHEIADLALGDVLLLTHNYLQSQRQLWLAAGEHAGLHVQLSNDNDFSQLTVLQAWSETMPSLIHDVDATANGAVSLDSIPIKINFDLGDIELSLAQVSALRPGQALTLRQAPSGSVAIRANGALIGHGDLVEIDGQMGVCISALHAVTPTTASAVQASMASETALNGETA